MSHEVDRDEGNPLMERWAKREDRLCASSKLRAVAAVTLSDRVSLLRRRPIGPLWRT